MKNENIKIILKKVAQLLAIHGENPFKIKHYDQAALWISKQDITIQQSSLTQLRQLNAIGNSIAHSIHEINTTGTLKLYQQLLSKTPQGVIDMLQVQGLGPKKIRMLWKTLDIESPAALLEACEQNYVAPLRGFGQKTQAAIQEHILFQQTQQGKVHYATAVDIFLQLKKIYQAKFSKNLIACTGDLRRKVELIDKIELLIGVDRVADITAWLAKLPLLEQKENQFDKSIFHATIDDIAVIVRFTTPALFYQDLILQTGSSKHLAMLAPDGQSIQHIVQQIQPHSEENFYQKIGLPYIPPELREGTFEIAQAKKNTLPDLLTDAMIKGPIHVHTTYSDGENTLEDIAQHCLTNGYEYVGIADHSQSAAYAGGMKIEEVYRQHKEIDRLNEKLAPFKILKGIESDILADGSLDYPPSVLSTFDFVIASIHSGLQMDKKKATDRLLTAISNPYTTMLGHATGRLLLRRKGYDIDHQAIIDACAAYQVVIEINANPWRLDWDWRWIQAAIQKGVVFSINPDTHNKESMLAHIHYGVCIARKGGLSAADTLNTHSCKAICAYFQHRKNFFSI